MVSLAVSARRGNRTAIGILLIVGSVFLMSVQDAAIKSATTDLTLWQIYLLRSPLALPLLWLAAVAGGGVFTWREVFDRWSLLRAACLCAMYILLYAGLPFLELATVATAMYTGPLFVTLLSALLIGEPVRLLGWLAVATGFAGVVIMLQPGADAFEPLVLLPVLSGFFYALAAVTTRGKCTRQNPFALGVTLNLALLATGLVAVTLLVILDLPYAIVAENPFLFAAWSDIDLQGWLLIAGLAVLMVGISAGLAAAYQSARPVVIATFDYSYLLFAVLWGYTIFSEIPELHTLFGMLLIAAAGLLVMRRG